MLSFIKPDEANAVIAFLALIVAGVSVFYAYNGIKLQQKHNRLSVVPVPFIALADYTNLVRVKIRNDGIGPLIINRLIYLQGSTRDRFDELVDYSPELPPGMHWSNFSSGYVRSVRPGDELILLEVYIDESNVDHVEYRENLRNILSRITVEIVYTDVYQSDEQTFTRKLDFFGSRRALSRIAA